MNQMEHAKAQGYGREGGRKLRRSEKSEKTNGEK